jgi:hypothetical protein
MRSFGDFPHDLPTPFQNTHGTNGYDIMNDDTRAIYATHETTQYEINYGRKETSRRRCFASSKSL